jgi:hypothetical protein
MAAKKRGGKEIFNKKSSKKKRMQTIFSTRNQMGLSTIIVTLIIILLSLVAVGILWGVVRNILNNQTEITQTENQFFSEQMDIQNVNYNFPIVNITLRRPAGEIKVSGINVTTTTTTSSMPSDVFSLVDLSGSMRQCWNITNKQCSNLLSIGDSYTSYTCDLLNTNKQATCNSYGGSAWNGQCTGVSYSQCNNLGGNYLSSICKFLCAGTGGCGSSKQSACTGVGGTWYGQCSNITYSQCNTLAGTYYNSSLCDTLPSNYQTGCINYGGIVNDKLTAAQNANINLINDLLNLGNGRVGLIGFNGAVSMSNSTGLTTNSILLNVTLGSWQATDATCICCAINNATARFQQQSPSSNLKSMIVMSDGQTNTLCSQQGTGNSIQDAINAACNANASLNNFVIYSVGLGTDVDAATLTSIAKCGGGKYFSAVNVSDLIGIYQGIAQQIQQQSQSVTSLSLLSFVFYNGTDTYNESEYNMPGILQTQTYNFDLTGELSGTLTKIEIYPVVILSNNKEIIGPLLNSWTPN